VTGTATADGSHSELLSIVVTTKNLGQIKALSRKRRNRRQHIQNVLVCECHKLRALVNGINANYGNRTTNRRVSIGAAATMNINRLVCLLGILTKLANLNGGGDGFQSLVIKPAIHEPLVRVASVMNN
jgi:hypothetical protein